MPTGSVRRRVVSRTDRIHDVAVSATSNVPHRTKKHSKTQLVHVLESFENLPEYLRDNEFIHGFYRKEQSMSSSIRTLFKLHNETGNVWTHFIGFFLFLGLALYFCYHPPTPLAVPAHQIEQVWHTVQDRFHDLRDSLDNTVLHTIGDNLNAISARVSGNVHALEDRVHVISDSLQHKVSNVLSSGVQQLSDRMSDKIHHLSDNIHQLQDNLQDLLTQRVGSPLHQLSDSVSTRAAHISSGLGHTADAVQHYFQQHAPGLSHKVELLQQHLHQLLQQQLGSVVQWPVPRWPVYVYFAGAMVCLLTSCVCHLLGCCQQHISEMVWRFDYAGIAVLIMASFVPAVYYAFMCQPFWRHFYIWTTTFMGMATIGVSLPTMFQAREYRVLRAMVFVGLGCWGFVPVTHMTILFWNTYAVRKAIILDLLMGATYLVGAAIFASRVPERWLPGKLDLWGHSHQLWHCAVVLAAYIHYHAVMVMLEWRDAAGGCAAPGLINGPVPELLQQMQHAGVEMLGIEGVWQHLGVELHKWAVAGAGAAAAGAGAGAGMPAVALQQ